jgi:hypothetical protein
MLKLVSKNVIALKTNPRIDEMFFEEIQNRLNNGHPLGPHKQKYDSGKPRMSLVEHWLGMGQSEDRAHSPGVGMGLGQDEGREDYLHKDRGLSSAYNLDTKRDGPYQDETGPGNTPLTPDPYYAVNTNELFLDEELKSGDRDSRIYQNVRKILDGPAITRPHRKMPVDRRMK